jgi:hypothetical protein
MAWNEILPVVSCVGLACYFLETVSTYKVNVTFIFDPLTQNSIGVIYWPRPVKNEGQGAFGCQVIGRKPFLTYNVSMTLTPKSIEVIYWLRPIQLCSLRAKGAIGCHVIGPKRIWYTRFTCIYKYLFLFKKTFCW